MLVNISQIPSEYWGESQKQAAALATEDGKVLDFHISVPVDFCKSQVQTLAVEKGNEIARLVSGDKNGTVLLVDIDQTFDFIFIKKMQARGYKCVAAIYDENQKFIKFRQF